MVMDNSSHKGTVIGLVTLIIVLVVFINILGSSSGVLTDAGDSASNTVPPTGFTLSETFIAVEGSTSTTSQPISSLSDTGVINTSDSVIVGVGNYTFIRSTGVISWASSLGSFNNSNLTVSYGEGRTATLPLNALFSSNGVLFLAFMGAIIIGLIVVLIRKAKKK